MLRNDDYRPSDEVTTIAKARFHFMPSNWNAHPDGDHFTSPCLSFFSTIVGVSMPTLEKAVRTGFLHTEEKSPVAMKAPVENHTSHVHFVRPVSIP